MIAACIIIIAGIAAALAVLFRMRRDCMLAHRRFVEATTAQRQPLLHILYTEAQ